MRAQGPSLRHPAWYCTAGLLRMVANEDELAAVLAHESAHVVARHAAERITQMGALEVARMLAYWWVGGWVAGQWGTGCRLGWVGLGCSECMPTCSLPCQRACRTHARMPSRRPPARLRCQQSVTDAAALCWLHDDCCRVFGLPIPAGPLSAIFFLPNSR